MSKNDYILNTPYGDILIESENRDINSEIVDALVSIRKDQSKTQQQVADFIGMDRANVARLEGKKHSTSLDILLKYAISLGMTLKVDVVPMNEKKK